MHAPPTGRFAVEMLHNFVFRTVITVVGGGAVVVVDSVIVFFTRKAQLVLELHIKHIAFFLKK